MKALQLLEKSKNLPFGKVLLVFAEECKNNQKFAFASKTLPHSNRTKSTKSRIPKTGFTGKSLPFSKLTACT
jgi:hypothetical protein